MNNRFLGKRKTLALGVYPEVSLATARKRRDEARKLLAEASTRARPSGTTATPVLPLLNKPLWR